jgi:hypothetical protein
MYKLLKVQKREFYTNPTQLSQLSGVALSARLHRNDTVQAYVDWRACTAIPLRGVS